jgi:hypothetical protein
VQFGETAAAQDASAHLDSDTQPSSDKVSTVWRTMTLNSRQDGKTMRPGMLSLIVAVLT